MRARVSAGAGRGLWATGLLLALGLPAAAQAAAAGADLTTSARAYYLFSLAQQDRFERNYRDALQHLRDAVALEPDAATLRLELARLYWLLGNRGNGFEDRGLQEAEEALRLAPEDVAVRRFLATAYSSLAGRQGATSEVRERAIANLEAVLRLQDPGMAGEERLELGKLYLQAGRAADARAALEEYLKTEEDSVEGIYWLSRAQAAEGDVDGADEGLRRALERSPRSFHLWEWAAELGERRQAWDDAITAARTLISLAPESVQQYGRLGRLYRLAGRPREALGVYQRLERLLRAQEDEAAQAALPSVRLAIIEALEEAGEPAEALERATAGAAAYPGDLRFEVTRGLLQYRTGDGEAGVATLDGLVARHPEDPRVRQGVSEAFLQLGAERERSGEIPESEVLLERAIEVDPENHAALNYLGYLWADLGKNLDRSVELIQEALRLDGDNGAYLDSLGWAYYRQGRFDLAREQLERAAEISGSEPEILDHLGDLYLATGRRREAIEAWQRALHAGAVDPDRIQAKIDTAAAEEDLPR